MSKRDEKKYKGIIFDFNGTLLFDSEKHLEAWREYSRQLRGKAFTDEEMRDYMFGRTNEDIIAYAIGRKPEPELVKKLGLEKEAVYRDMCRNDRENFKLAPPTRPPSISDIENSSLAFAAFTLPPYCIITPFDTFCP